MIYLELPGPVVKHGDGSGMGKKFLQCHYWGASTRFRFGWVPSFCAASGSIESPPTLDNNPLSMLHRKKKDLSIADGLPAQPNFWW